MRQAELIITIKNIEIVFKLNNGSYKIQWPEEPIDADMYAEVNALIPIVRALAQRTLKT